MKMSRVLMIGAAGLLLGGLTMGAAPRVVAPKTETKAAVNPFAPKAPAAAAKVENNGNGGNPNGVGNPNPGGGNPNTDPGGWNNDPPGKAVRKHRPPVRPGHRPPPRSKFRPEPKGNGKH
jgi:hypothetical protein